VLWWRSRKITYVRFKTRLFTGLELNLCSVLYLGGLRALYLATQLAIIIRQQRLKWKPAVSSHSQLCPCDPLCYLKPPTSNLLSRYNNSISKPFNNIQWTVHYPNIAIDFRQSAGRRGVGDEASSVIWEARWRNIMRAISAWGRNTNKK
jgi:hypothetical protein